MSIGSRTLALAALLVATLAAPAAAQDGFALKGSYIYNRSDVEGATRMPGSSGFGVGAEYVLPGGLGVGVNAYTGGKVREFEVETSSVSVALEANYFLGLPLLSPYVGVHAGLGRYSQVDDTRPGTRIRDSATELGYQAGLRLQLTSLLGLDAQYRRVSTSLATDQGTSLSRNQVLLGITLF